MRDVHLGGRRHHGGLLTLGEQVTEQIVLAVPLDVGLGESGCEPALHHVVLRRTAALLDLADVIAEVRLHRIGDLTDRARFRRVLEPWDALAFPPRAALTAGRRASGLL